MKGIVVIGAGGHGRGIHEILAARARLRGDEAPVVAFLDDAVERIGSSVAGVPVVGTTAEVPRLAREGHRFLIGLGEPDARRTVAERIAASGAEFATAIHPSAVLYGDVQFGPGAVVAACAVIAASTRLAAHTLVNLGATIGHDCVLEAFATVAPGAHLGGNVTLAEASFVGLGGVVVPGKRLGPESRLGPGSVLLDDLDGGAIAFGVPARVVDRKGRA